MEDEGEPLLHLESLREWEGEQLVELQREALREKVLQAEPEGLRDAVRDTAGVLDREPDDVTVAVS